MNSTCDREQDWLAGTQAAQKAWSGGRAGHSDPVRAALEGAGVIRRRGGARPLWQGLRWLPAQAKGEAFAARRVTATAR